jgi:hypothetical protein
MELLIAESTKKILQESNDILMEKNKKYYRDVLDFLNLLFEDDAKNINKIKFKKITLNNNIFTMYNEINKQYKLNKPEFNSADFDLSEIDDTDEIKNIFVDIAYTFSNNLLEKINYKLIKKINKEDNKTKFLLKYIN